MKVCPLCQSTFEDRVDFCFRDGHPLEVMEGSADPTALPDPEVAMTSSIADAPTQVRKKPRRGMFARPSVADMLTVSGSQVPPVGGNRVVTPAVPNTTLGTPTIIEEPDEPAPDVDFGAAPDVIAVEPAEVDTAPDATELPEPPSFFGEMGKSPSALDVPVDPEVVDVPVPESHAEAVAKEAPEQRPDDLDDSWFGGEDEFDEAPPPPVEDFDSGPPGFDEPIEDPGFADVDDPGEVGFDDRSWSATGGGVRTDASIPKSLIVGGLGVLVAAVALTVMFSADEESPIPPPVAAVQKTVESPPEPPPPPPVQDEVANDEPVEGVVEDVEGATEEDNVLSGEDGEPAEEASDEQDAVVAAAIPPPVAVETTPAPAQPVESGRTPPPVAPPAPVASRPAPTTERPAPANPPSVWTGSPSGATDPAPEAPAANPWGAPAEVASRGRLTITTDPAGAMVYVDERRIGRSPTRTEVPYGTHNVRVEMLDYRTSSRVVSVRASEVSVPFRLEAAQLSGRCNLLGEPGSEVAMNGRRIGSLPITVECNPGVHRFDIQPAAGGEPFTLSRSVTFVHAGETENIFLNAP